MLSYDIYAYAGMISDEVRTNVYVEALRQTVTPDSVVLDLGTGVGIWALLACKFGARKVYAIDPNDVIHVAREVAIANGLADKIIFIQQMSTEITLPERADILVTDMHGIVPMFEQNIPSIIDARQRLVKRGGQIIPQQDSLWAVPVVAPECFDHAARPWIDRPYGFDWSPAKQVAVNDWFMNKANLTPADFLDDPVRWAELDYRKLIDPNVGGKIEWTARRSGVAHGLLIWFDSELIDNIGFSNAPGQPKTIFRQAFFPWVEPVTISRADKISVTLRCDLVESFHLWRWQTVIHGNEGSTKPKAQFAQSSFLHMPLMDAAMNTDTPKLNPRGQLQQFILSQMNGKHSFASIVALVIEKFGADFRDEAEARRTVANVVIKYSNRGNVPVFASEKRNIHN